MAKENIESADHKPTTVKVHVGNDLDILKQFPDNYFDWVYLDSSHEYNHTTNELTILKEKVKDSGYITGHDWHRIEGQPHHGVYKAVMEFSKQTKWDIFKIGCYCQWSLKIMP